LNVKIKTVLQYNNNGAFKNNQGAYQLDLDPHC